MTNTPVEVWERCLKFIKDNLTGRAYDTWFLPIKPLKLENNILVIEVPSTFYYEYLEENYIDLLSTSLRKELGKDAKLEYSILMDPSTESYKKTMHLPGKENNEFKNRYNKINEYSKEEQSIKNPFVIPGIKNIQIDSQLNPSLSFNNFIEGECNKLARTAGLTIAENPGKTAFNPLFIYSDAGLGKSHLCHAIGLEIKERHPKKTVLYLDALTFETQYTESSRKNNRNDFLHFYQMIDVLIIDDIHELTGKAGTQSALFQVFNSLHQKHKQIILTSDKPPIELQGMEKRLLSRFKWGLSAELNFPDFQTRVAVLKKKIYNDGLDIKDEIIEYIANNATTSVREMEGTLISLLAQSTLTKKEINLGLAKNVVEKLVKNTKKDLSIEYIQEQVCDYFNIPTDQLKSKTRKREIVQSRQIAMYFAKSLTKSSLATIGAKIGGKDHATVLHACKTVNNLIDTDKRFKNYIEELEKRLK